MKRWQKIVGGGAVFVAALVILSAYVSQVAANSELQATLRANEKVMQESARVQKELADQLQGVKDQLKDVDQQRQADRDRFASLQRTTTTPQQIATEIKKILPNFGEVKIQPDPVRPDKAQVTISQEQWDELWKASLNWKAAQAENAGLVKRNELLERNVKLLEQTVAQKDVDIKALKDDLDSAKKAAKGGSFWKRVKSGARFTAVGVVIGLVAASVF